MRKLLAALCCYAAAGMTLEHEPIFEQNDEFLTFTEWSEIYSQRCSSEDFIVLRDSNRLYGTLAQLPSIKYSFGEISFEPQDVAVVNCVQNQSQLILQYITREGQNFTGPAGNGKFQVLTGDLSQQNSRQRVKKDVEPKIVSLILLKERSRKNVRSDKRLFSLKLRNGDQFPALILTESLELSDGWKERSLNMDAIIELSFNGGVQGLVLEQHRPAQLGFHFLKNQYLMVQIPSYGSVLQLPWDQIQAIQAQNGGFFREPEEGLPKIISHPLPDTIDEIVLSNLQSTFSDSFGNTRGSLLGGAHGAMAVHPKAFKGLDLIGMDKLSPPKALFNESEADTWVMDIAFDALIEKRVKTDEEIVREIAEALIFEDIPRIDVDPEEFDVIALDDIDEEEANRLAFEALVKNEEKPLNLAEIELELESDLADFLATSFLEPFGEEIAEEKIEKKIVQIEDPSLIADDLSNLTPKLIQDILLGTVAVDKDADLTPQEIALLKELLGDEAVFKPEETFEKKEIDFAKMAYVAAGELIMSPTSPLEAKAKGTLIPLQNQVMLLVIAEGFYIDRTPVTNEEYELFVIAADYPSPRHWVNGKVPERQNNLPVVNVSYQDAKSYAVWCGKELPSTADWLRAQGNQAFQVEPTLNEWTTTSHEKGQREVVTGNKTKPLNENAFDYNLGFRTIYKH
jgi:hypothetical protein